MNSASVIGSLQQPVTKKLFFSESFPELPGKLVKQGEIKCERLLLPHPISFKEVSQTNSRLDSGRTKFIISLVGRFGSVVCRLSTHKR